jgi:hypothetical protein
LVAKIQQFGKKGRPGAPFPLSAVIDWIGQPFQPSHQCAFEGLAWCQALPRLAAVLPERVWWDLLQELVSLATDAGGIDLEQNPLVHQIMAGEVPLTLAYLLPEITACRKLARPARHALSAGLTELCDGEGLLHGRWLALLRPLLACWTRSRAIGNQLASGCWNKAAQTQYEWLVRQALRLTRADGGHVLSVNGAPTAEADVLAAGAAGAWCEDLFAAALDLGGNQDDLDIAAVALPGRKKAEAREVRKLALPGSACHSEWAATTVLRTDWARAEPRLVAVWPDHSVRLELECHSEVLWSGHWDLEIVHGGRRLEPKDPWQEVCWVSDDDVDYLELHNELPGGVRVERHMLLAREDSFLFVADAIVAQAPTGLEYRQCLPLCDGIEFEPAHQTHEGYLVGRKKRAFVLPLGLPEWRTDAGGDSLAQSGRQLELRQSTDRQRLFAPLFLDLSPRRMTRQFTWRQLTVAENREIVPSDVAVGYRVMVGTEQWLVYRSLAKTANRTVLGHNLTSELLVARFDREGEVEPLMEIE